MLRRPLCGRGRWQRHARTGRRGAGRTVGGLCRSSGCTLPLVAAATAAGSPTHQRARQLKFSDRHTGDAAAATGFYAPLFGWEFDDIGFATMIRRPGYGDHLAATVDPGIHERQEGISAPPGFADAIGWMVPLASGHDHWHVTFTVTRRVDGNG